MVTEVYSLDLKPGYVAVATENVKMTGKGGINLLKSGKSDIGAIKYVYKGCSRFKPGDRVLLPPFRSVLLLIAGEKLAIINEEEILVTISYEEDEA